MILILVDVDNLIGKLDRLPNAGELQVQSVLPVVKNRVPRASSVVVCMAMNLKSASTFADWMHVQSLADQIARRIVDRVGELRVEVALCLSTPEASDVALLKMLAQAPAPEHQTVDEIWMLSQDRGLLSSIEDVLQQLCCSDRQEDHWRWRLPPGVQRTAPDPPVCIGEAASHLPKITALVDSPGRCVLVATRSLQSSLEWPALLDIVARNPWVLSQIGLTFHDGHGQGEGVTRGVARLRDGFASSQPVKLACAPGDGLEYGVEGTVGAWLAVPRDPSVREASVGVGAVRLEWQENGQERGLTLRAQIPAWLAASGPGRVRVSQTGEPRLDELERLGTLSGAVGGPTVQVRVKSYGGDLRFKVVSGRRCWWWAPSSEPWSVPTPKGSWRLSGLAVLSVHPWLTNTTIDAVQGVAPGANLHLRSPLSPGELVILPASLPRGALGLGTTPARTKVAVLATRNLQALPLSCEPIQVAKPSRLQKLLQSLGVDPLTATGLIPLLQELPLVVPVSTSVSSRSGQAL